MSSLTVFAILAAASGRVRQLLGTVRQTVLRPIGRVFDFLLAPVDRGFSPFAKAFNRVLGPYVGRVTGLQLAFLLVTFLLLLTGGFWGASVIVFEPGSGLVATSMLRTLALASCWAIFAMGWDIQSGYTGYISFGHSALSGGAAYATAIMLNEISTSLPFYITAPVSVVVAVVIGLVIALPSLRLEGPYFSLVTFAAVLLFYSATLAIDVLGGSAGLVVNRLVPLQGPLGGPIGFTRYYMMMLPMLAIAIILTILLRSNYGLIFTAIRENEDAVSAAGLNPTKFKIWSFFLSAIVMGIGGVMLASFYSNVDPTTFVQVDRSIEMIAMAVLGGMASVLGALGGAFVFFLLRDEILGLFIEESALRLMLLFIVVIGILVFARDGLFRKLWHRLGKVRDGGDES